MTQAELVAKLGVLQCKLKVWEHDGTELATAELQKLTTILPGLQRPLALLNDVQE